MSNEKTHGQRIAEKVFYHVVDTTQKDRLAETIDAVIAELTAPNPVEIDQIKPAGETGAEEFLQSYLDKPDAVVVSRTSTILAMRDYATLRAQEARAEGAEGGDAYTEALKWYKQGVEDASDNAESIFEDGIEADFHERYADQFTKPDNQQ